jgi:tRNA dimethylallyltransferase
LALRVAERLGGEIIGCDALQVYSGFNVATAKPSEEARRRVPHHLVDVIDPRRDFNMADFVREAERLVSEIRGRGHVPLVVGGTGLYLRGLLRGVVEAPPRDERTRQRLRAVLERRGPRRLHRWLARRDPESARRLSPGDSQRIVRALELALSGGATWSERLRSAGTWAGEAERYDALKIGLDMNRERLAARLDDRVDRFFEAGLVDEVRGLLAAGLPPGANAFKAIGYREVLAELEAGRDPAGARDEVKRNTRRYAKRQRTWFRKEPGITWLDAETEPGALAERVVALWSAFRA